MKYAKKGKKFCPDSKIIKEEIIENCFAEVYRILTNDNKEIIKGFIDKIDDILSQNNSKNIIEKLDLEKENLEGKQNKLLNLVLDGTIDKAMYTSRNEVKNTLSLTYLYNLNKEKIEFVKENMLKNIWIDAPLDMLINGIFLNNPVTSKDFCFKLTLSVDLRKLNLLNYIMKSCKNIAIYLNDWSDNNMEWLKPREWKNRKYIELRLYQQHFNILLDYFNKIYPTKDAFNGTPEPAFDVCFDKWIGKDDWYKIIYEIEQDIDDFPDNEKIFLSEFLKWLKEALKYTTIIVVEGNL